LAVLLLLSFLLLLAFLLLWPVKQLLSSFLASLLLFHAAIGIHAVASVLFSFLMFSLLLVFLLL
jgi:hypothetical protein